MSDIMQEIEDYRETVRKFREAQQAQAQSELDASGGCVARVEKLEDAARLLLARMEEWFGPSYWMNEPETDLQEAAQKLAKLVPPQKRHNAPAQQRA